MNSKELKEQARENIRKQETLIGLMDDAEKVVDWIDRYKLEIYVYGTCINSVILPEAVNKIKEISRDAVNKFVADKQSELEQLLGIQSVPDTIITTTCVPTREQHIEVIPAQEPDRKPATINPEFDALFDKQPDTVGDKLSEITQKEEVRIKGEPDENSLGSYPAQKARRQAKLSDDLLPDIKRMYVDEGKTAKEIAAQYKGVTPNDVNNFVNKHHLHRKQYDKILSGSEKPQKQPDETERP